MNQYLKTIQDVLQQNKKLSEEDKEALIKAITDADKQWSITDFKLDRTEKVKKTTAILLEETIEELEQKRKAVEAQNRELEIESSLERVRTVAMGMQRPADMPEICRIIAHQLESLGIKEIRNVQTAIFQKEKGTYINYEYYRRHNKTLITEVDYTNDEISLEFAAQMMKGANEIFIRSLTGKQVEDWYNFQKTTNVFIDTWLEKAKSLTYYWFSLGPVALGISTYDPLSEEEINLFKRFRNVFELAYRRFIDIELAIAQAKEARIETALERVRAVAMAMRKPEDLSGIGETLFTELTTLDFPDLRNTEILINNDSKETITSYYYSDYGVTGIIEVFYKDHPTVRAWAEQMQKAGDAFAEVVIPENEMDAWRKYREEIGYLPDQKLDKAKTVYYYSYSIGLGGLSISTFKPISKEQIKILERFRNVFNLSYQRYTDIAQAEAQAREAQIELGLERVRARAMAMRNSDELTELVDSVFKELTKLHFTLTRCFIWIFDADTLAARVWMANSEIDKTPKSYFVKYLDHPFYNGMINAWKNRDPKWIYDLKGDDKKSIDALLFNETEMSLLPEEVKKGMRSNERTFVSTSFNNFGCLQPGSLEPLSGENLDILSRFGKVFDLTYTRFNDLKQAEAQAREAKIEAALERVRARALAMQQPEELKNVAQVLRTEMGLLGVEELETCSIYIHVDNSNNAECWYALKDPKQTEKRMVSDHFALDLNDTWVGRQMLQFYNSNEKHISIVMTGANRREWIEYCYKHSPEFTGFYGETIPDRTYHLYKFSHGAIGAAAPGDISEESWRMLTRAASVFSLAYSRFKDLSQARTGLIKLKEEKKRAEDALTELQATQKQLIQSEKMASLGELTAGIAHEIQNPLNFVNNFSDVSNELLEEMKTELVKGNKEDAMAIAEDVKQNLEKILHHGKRADAIVKGMLQHSRMSSGQKELADINNLADEYLRLAYHGLRAKNKSFNAKFETDLDKSIDKINIIPQDIGRVLVNLINNAFYAVSEKQKQNIPGYEPTVKIKTLKNPPLGGRGAEIEVRIKDNGTGIPQKVLDKIFQPFFTTKPTGQGTGLGLSLSYDVVKAHGGELKVETKEAEGTEFIIQLPMQ
jgi:signal transduction histidine kinase